MFKQLLAAVLASLSVWCSLIHPASGQEPAKIESRYADVNGVRLHYLAAGAGDPVVLLHGYAQNSHMWRPLIAELAKTHLVIAPDLRGFGEFGQAG